MTYEAPKKKKSNPLNPLIGFIVFLASGTASWFGAPAVINWLETTELSLGFFGSVLPITFPSNWPPLVSQGFVALVMFMIIFAVLMIAVFALVDSPRGELDIGLEEVRKRKKDRR